MDDLLDQGVLNSFRLEAPREAFVMDIGDPVSYLSAVPQELNRRGAVFAFGGMLGEILLTLTCMMEYLLANPENADFALTEDGIESFLI